QDDRMSPPSSCHPVSLSSCHPVILSSCHPVILSSCHPVSLSSRHLQCVFLSTEICSCQSSESSTSISSCSSSMWKGLVSAAVMLLPLVIVRMSPFPEATTTGVCFLCWTYQAIHSSPLMPRRLRSRRMRRASGLLCR